MSTYAALKSLHILAVAMFLGNIVTGLFWKSHADRSGDARIMAHTIEGVIRSDRWFTMPGVFAIIIFGVMTALNGHLPIMRTPWIMQSLVLFAISGLAFGFQVAPLQKRLLAIASATPMDMALYKRLSRRWEIFGAIAILTPLVALWLMVAKPA